MANPNDINDLWLNGSEEDWQCALELYYRNPYVIKNQQLENEMADLDPECIKALDSESFYKFLYNKYFLWKYGSDHRRLVTTRKLLELHEAETASLGRIQANIFKVFEIDPGNTELLFCCTRQIHGLGTAGASGLLSILFPKYYGTVDQRMVRALQRIEALQEHEKIQAIKNPADLTTKDGVLLENVLRKKAEELNKKFETSFWTPRKVDMVLWASDIDKNRTE